MAPGQSSDKSGFVRVEGRDGTFYGKIPVPLLGMAGPMWWSKTGLTTPVGEWDFSKKEYRYWNERQTEEYVRHVR